MEEFESLLRPWRGALERFVYFRISIRADAEDVLQDIYMTAYKNFDSLREKEAFRGWIFAIARNKCKDYFAMLSKRMEISYESMEEKRIPNEPYGHFGFSWESVRPAPGVSVLNCERLYDGPERKYEETLTEAVWEVLEKLKDKDKRILYLYFFRELPQADIAKILGIPVGTVKSRLHNAKEKFKNIYLETAVYPKWDVNIISGKNAKPEGSAQNAEREADETKRAESERPESEITMMNAKRNAESKTDKERIVMKKFPEIIPDYKIKKSYKEPFAVRWEELLGWFIIPRLGEKSSFAIYDRPDGKCNWVHAQEVIGEAEVHGIYGVEIACRSWNYEEYLSKYCGNKGSTIDCFIDGNARERSTQEPERILVAQLTDTHCRYLASTEKRNGVKKYRTFLDGEEFTGDWGFGEDNCGKEVNVRPKGDVIRDESKVTYADKPYLLDVVGRYEVTINGKNYDTICVMNVEANVNGTVTEQFIDENGKTVLWRIYCQDDWHFAHYNKFWTEMLPDSERLDLNGLTYVHWYDCITEYVL